MMHILYLHQYFVPPDGTGGTRSYEMARRLVKSGHRVTMITSSAFFPEHYKLTGNIYCLDIEGISLRIIRVSYSNKLSYTSRIKSFIEFAFKSISEIVKIRDVDIVFATSTPLTIAIPAFFGKFWHKIPMVFEVRDLWPELPIAIGALRNPLLKSLARWLERTAYAQSTHVVALSPGMKEGVVSTGFPREHVSVIPNSCDVELFSRPANTNYFKNITKQNGQPVILYAGTFGPINGVDYLVDVAEAMTEINPDICFAIVGDGKQQCEVLEKARDKKVLNKNLWMLPPVAKSEMPDILASSTVACSLFINLPQMWHNSANKFFDALAAGKPILINYGGWQADVINSSGAGLVVPPDDPITAAKRLHEFLCDQQRVAHAHQASAQLASTEFSRDHLFAKLLEVFESVHCKYKNIS